MAIESKLHLVPVLKGAMDPRAGIILRTYYIRPEKLQQMVQDAREVPSKSYIVKIPNYNEITTTINTGNILPLYNAFDKNRKNSKVWGSIVTRNETKKTVLTEQHYRQMLGQNTYAFLLTNDKLQLKTIPEMTKNSSVTKALLVTSTEKPIKPKLKRTRAKVKEQFELKTTDNPFDLEQNDDIQPDYGTQVKYKQKLYTVNDGKRVGAYLSNTINFLNMNPAKVKSLVASLIATTSLNDKYNVVKHLVLRNSIYSKEANFWTALLEKQIPETDDPDSNLYQALTLQKLDNKTFKLMRKSGLLNSNVLDVVDNGYTKHLDNPLVLASLTPDEVQDVLTNHRDAINMNTLPPLTLDMKPETVYSLIKQYNPEVLDPSQLLSSVFENDTESPAYYLLQMAVSQVYGLEYIPYSEFSDIKTVVFKPMIATKIYPYYWSEYKARLQQYINEAQSNLDRIPDPVDVGMHTPSSVPIDYQYFLRMKPAQVFELYDKDKHNIRLTIKKKAVFATQGKKLLVFNPLDNIIDQV